MQEPGGVGLLLEIRCSAPTKPRWLPWSKGERETPRLLAQSPGGWSLGQRGPSRAPFPDEPPLLCGWVAPFFSPGSGFEWAGRAGEGPFPSGDGLSKCTPAAGGMRQRPGDRAAEWWASRDKKVLGSRGRQGTGRGSAALGATQWLLPCSGFFLHSLPRPF